MSKLERHREVWPYKSDEWLFERLANELTQKVETIHVLLKINRKLAADKAELLEALEEILDGKKDGRTYISMDEIESLIEKHKK